MDGHDDFEVFVKNALEAGATVDAKRLDVIAEIAAHEAVKRRKHRFLMRFGSVSLAAAVLIFALVLNVTISNRGNTADVSDVIGLLCETDGIAEDEIGEASAGEILLAWQDAPCVNLL